MAVDLTRYKALKTLIKMAYKQNKPETLRVCAEIKQSLLTKANGLQPDYYGPLRTEIEETTEAIDIITKFLQSKLG